MKNFSIIIISIILLLGSCVSQFVPQTTEDKQMLVVEGLITDNPDINYVRLSKSLPLGTQNTAKPLSGSTINLTDDLGQVINFREQEPGTYVPEFYFSGTAGRLYTLHIASGSANNNLIYQSIPMELKSSPPIDSIYYQKVAIESGSDGRPVKEGCDIFLNTHDPSNKCLFYRWEYSETWEFHLPYMVPKSICWLTEKSEIINIKNTSMLAENRVDKFKINYVSNETDRLSQKYSILVHQFALTEDEFMYWDKLENISEQVGGLYDMIPASIPSNVYCPADPNEKVLGYFSVSGTSSKRIFIKDHFAGISTPYTTEVCVADTIWGPAEIPNLGTFVWVIIDHPLPPPSYQVTTRIKGCYDCTLRGSDIQPSFWYENK